MRSGFQGGPGAGTLRTHLLVERLAGSVPTSREKSLLRYRLFAARDPRVLLGLEPERDWPVADLIELVANGCGVAAEPDRTQGTETIAPERTLDALDAFAERLRRAVQRRSPVLFGTGRPGRLLGFHGPLAQALRAAGCRVLTPGAGRGVAVPTRFGLRTYRIGYVSGVALVHGPGARCDPGAPGVPTRSPLPLRTVLAAAVDEGGPLPELVVGDHGWVCAAGQLGIDAMGPANVDDPAPFVAQAEGRPVVAVPLNDAEPPDCYRPLARYVVNHCLSPR